MAAVSDNSRHPRIQNRSPLQMERHLDWRELAQMSTAKARQQIPYEVANRLQALALDYFQTSAGQDVLTVAVSDANDLELLRHLRFVCGCEIDPRESHSDIIAPAIDSAYCANADALVGAMQRVSNGFEPDTELSSANILDSQEPVPELVETLLKRAVSLAASDIHFEPLKNFYRVRYRIDGRLLEDPNFKIHPAAAAQILRRLKILSQLDTTGTPRPQDGGFGIKHGGLDLRARLSLLPLTSGEKAVIRLFETEVRQEQSNFAALGLSPEQESELIRYLEGDSGTLLLSGPTGSGKSTLLSAALGYLNDSEHQIISIEDPVERIIPGISQVDLSTQSTPAADLLPFLLRQDPDVIMLGEIREQATAQLALSAGLTGHLVLSTVHAGSALEILERLFEFGLSARLMACSLGLLVSQRLVLKNCPHCVRETRVSTPLQRLFGLPEDFIAQAGHGCQQCHGLGGRGRTGVYEFLPVRDETRSALEQRRVNAGILRQAAISDGYAPYAVQVRQLLFRGLISPHEALRVLGLSPTLFGTDRP